MAIQWFPGHMNSARKQVAEIMAKVDLIIEVLDARLPWSSSNPMIESLRLARQRPALKIINKADLADSEMNNRWLNWFSHQNNTTAMLIGMHNRDSAKSRIVKACQSLAPHRTGEVKPLRAMILGIPNVGKSTLLNHLAGRKLANVADTPGVTKSQQRIETISGLILYDTPGLMWPKVEHEVCGLRLALGGSIGRNAYDEVEVALFAIEELKNRYPKMLQERYKLPSVDAQPEVLLQEIGRRRGAMLGGGRIDEQKAAEVLITDFRSGSLGKITLEAPEEILATTTSVQWVEDEPVEDPKQ